MEYRAEAQQPKRCSNFLAFNHLALGDLEHQACRRPPHREPSETFGAESVASSTDEFAKQATSPATSMVAPQSGNLTPVHKKTNAFADVFG